MKVVHIFVRMELRGMVPTVPMSSEGIGTRCGSGKSFGVGKFAKTCEIVPKASRSRHYASQPILAHGTERDGTASAVTTE